MKKKCLYCEEEYLVIDKNVDYPGFSNKIFCGPACERDYEIDLDIYLDSLEEDIEW